MTQSAARHSVAHVAPQFPVRATAIHVDATRPRAEGVDRVLAELRWLALAVVVVVIEAFQYRNDFLL